jgi:excinuclease Cho
MPNTPASGQAPCARTPAPARLLVSGYPAEAPPHCPGIYRMYGGQGQLLYVGKSVDLCRRLQQHHQLALQRERQRRLLRQVAVIDCQPTAGEVGALLLENAAIKTEGPLYNRRQRQLRQLWTWRLDPDPSGYLVPQVVNLLPGPPAECEVFGLFASRHAARERLLAIQRSEQLCARILTRERGRGPCFQYQLGRCRGACCGEDDPAAHNARLCAALRRQRVLAWPLAGPVLLHEPASSPPAPGQPAEQWHLVSHWLYLGTFDTPAEAGQAARVFPRRPQFDRDSYRILSRVLGRRRPRDLGLYRADTLAVVCWPAAG